MDLWFYVELTQTRHHDVHRHPAPLWVFLSVCLLCITSYPLSVFFISLWAIATETELDTVMTRPVWYSLTFLHTNHLMTRGSHRFDTGALETTFTNSSGSLTFRSYYCLSKLNTKRSENIGLLLRPLETHNDSYHTLISLRTVQTETHHAQEQALG